MQDSIGVWEGEGGSLNPGSTRDLTGLVNQIEFAERIRLQVDGEFDRVARALELASRKQSGEARLATQTMIGILEDKRVEVMANQRAGYFIHDWQELRDQVRKMIMNDARYKVLQAEKRRRTQNQNQGHHVDGGAKPGNAMSEQRQES